MDDYDKHLIESGYPPRNPRELLKDETNVDPSEYEGVTKVAVVVWNVLCKIGRGIEKALFRDETKI